MHQTNIFFSSTYRTRLGSWSPSTSIWHTPTPLTAFHARSWSQWWGSLLLSELRLASGCLWYKFCKFFLITVFFVSEVHFCAKNLTWLCGLTFLRAVFLSKHIIRNCSRYNLSGKQHFVANSVHLWEMTCNTEEQQIHLEMFRYVSGYYSGLHGGPCNPN